MDDIEYLYHYTSIETLALILKNKNFRFNRLDKVDDLEEGQTSDFGNLGKFAFVSCWTGESQESIPMWNMYTPDMKGVRIKLPKTPFKKYHIKKGECCNQKEFISNIDLLYHYNKYKYCIPVSIIKPYAIEYTNDENKLHPKIYTEKLEPDPDNKGKFIQNRSLNYGIIGKFKNKIWKFQNEYRYILSITPFTIFELGEINKNHDAKGLNELIYRYKTNKLPFSDYFLNIDDENFRDMEILIGPKASESQKIIVESLVKEFNPETKIKYSNIKVR